MKYPQLVSMPSAVSNWLEEQLEARGIDAVLYTRYVLSLLHAHPADVITSDEDLQLSQLKKEVRRSGGGRKRFRRSSDWWRHDQADVDQLKRSAAVECLMSASDQNCEIESLVDELCAKLKEIEQQGQQHLEANESSPLVADPKPKQQQSPQEQAEKYYAAFPPLSKSAASPSKLILIPKWIASPKKKTNRKSHTNLNLTSEKMNVCNAKRPKKDSGFSLEMDDVLMRENAGADQCVESMQCMNIDDENSLNMYDDLPVNLNKLLESPTPKSEPTGTFSGLANMKNDGNRGFIPLSKSGIWSTDSMEDFDNQFNMSKDLEDKFHSHFDSVALDNEVNNANSFWPSVFTLQNETNLLKEQASNSFFSGFHSNSEVLLPSSEDMSPYNELACSLMKIGHNKSLSAFVEVLPGTNTMKNITDLSKANPYLLNCSPPKRYCGGDKEDLLTSERSHFCPISEQAEKSGHGQYANGATFQISNSLEKVHYRRSESGLYVDTGLGQYKKYREYYVDGKYSSPESSPDEFVLKYSICQNDKACQTDDEYNPDHDVGFTVPSFPKFKEELKICTCPIVGGPTNYAMNTENCATGYNSHNACELHPDRPDSMSLEVVWQTCDKCNNNTTAWSRDWVNSCEVDATWDSAKLKNIWSNAATNKDDNVCQACMGDGRKPPTPHHTQLREDILHDGEELLSDLSSLQNAYMNTGNGFESPDILVLPKEAKRRNSYMSSVGRLQANGEEDLEEPGVLHARGSWSFASRLEEDCLIQMSTLPTLRSVTL